MLLYLVDIKVRTAVGPCDRWGLGSFEALTDGLMIDSPVCPDEGTSMGESEATFTGHLKVETVAPTKGSRTE